MIDLHSHILPGLDDGAGSIELALEMAQTAVADGIEKIAATPHVRAADYPTRPDEMELRLKMLRAALHSSEIPLEVLPGGEIALEMLAELDDATLRRFGLGGNPRYLLIETPYYGWPLRLEETFFDLRLRGFTAVLAHPERNRDVQEKPALLESLVEQGALIQVTASSVDGRLGSRSRASARHLIACGLAHVLASDAHAASVREVGLTNAVKAISDPALAEWLTQAVPEAILEDRAIPPRPELATGLAQSTVRKMLHRAGISKPPLAIKEPPNNPLPQASGDLLHLDTRRYARAPEPAAAMSGDRAKQSRKRTHPNTGVGYDYAHTIVDDHSQLAYVEIHDDQSAATVTDFVERALAFFAERGIHATRLMTDSGFSYVNNSSLQELLIRNRIRPLTIDPHRPRANGLVERFHQTMGREWAYGVDYRSHHERNRALPRWLDYYNRRKANNASQLIERTTSQH